MLAQQGHILVNNKHRQNQTNDMIKYLLYNEFVDKSMLNNSPYQKKNLLSQYSGAVNDNKSEGGF